MSALLLLGPWTPMLFQGQEWSSASPFVFFADHEEDLAAKVRKGRREFLAQFPSLASRAVQAGMPEPSARASFEASKLDWSESLRSERGQQSLSLHRDLLRLRCSDPVLRAVAMSHGSATAAVLEDDCFAVRFSDGKDAERLLVVNLGTERSLRPVPEPLLAPPAGCGWRLGWTSEDPRYGGYGTPENETDETGWHIAGMAALLFFPTTE